MANDDDKTESKSTKVVYIKLDLLAIITFKGRGLLSFKTHIYIDY